jgi:hypothetical protein
MLTREQLLSEARAWEEAANRIPMQSKLDLNVARAYRRRALELRAEAARKQAAA